LELNRTGRNYSGNQEVKMRVRKTVRKGKRSVERDALV
jgi:hypothetical protein